MVFTGVALPGIGCGGLGASGSVSPATFLLPGLMYNDSQRTKAQDPIEKQSSPQIAAVEQHPSPQVTAFSADLVQ